MEEQTKTKPKKGRLYIVSTHIGNKEDITIRATEVLKLSDIVICEELKIGAKILKELNINNKLETMNEQNESEKVFEFIELIKSGKKLALISDSGTPVFADPGAELVRNALISDIEIIVVPGVSSLMAAIVRSGMPLNQFLYAGFLLRNSAERVQQLKELAKEKRTVVLYDTPYRLLPVLEDICKIMPHRRAYIGMNLTMAFETHHYGTFQELYDKFKDERIKAEFVIVFEGVEKDAPQRIEVEFEDEDIGDRKSSSDRNYERNRDDRRSFDRRPSRAGDRRSSRSGGSFGAGGRRRDNEKAGGDRPRRDSRDYERGSDDRRSFDKRPSRAGGDRPRRASQDYERGSDDRRSFDRRPSRAGDRRASRSSGSFGANRRRGDKGRDGIRDDRPRRRDRK